MVPIKVRQKFPGLGTLNNLNKKENLMVPMKVRLSTKDKEQPQQNGIFTRWL
ncbi:hypothetical protein BC832DRAFT_544057 [Gaertneriomyces semiglobifer]|nr:hypothetical protein BC832DRAFT_544057 [Gaertneriomyces semiglobifer]